ACRFTTAAPPETAPRFEQWLESEQHGEMAYLARNASKRVDPQRVLPGAKSIITLAASYAKASDATCQESSSDLNSGNGNLTRDIPHLTPPPGVIARYARYSDYHDIIGARAKRLSELVNELGGDGTRSLWYVDTGPLLERDLAQRAGLGFIGKHTNLV